MTFTVYSKPACSFCDKAKALLSANGINYKEKVFDVGQPKVEGKEYVDLTAFKQSYPEVKSVPQIFVEGTRIGGFTELTQFLAAHH